MYFAPFISSSYFFWIDAKMQFKMLFNRTHSTPWPTLCNWIKAAFVLLLFETNCHRFNPGLPTHWYFAPTKFFFTSHNQLCVKKNWFSKNTTSRITYIFCVVFSVKMWHVAFDVFTKPSSDYLGKRPDFGYFSLHPSLIWMRFSLIKCLQRMLSNHIHGDMWHMGSSLFLIVLQMW